MVGMLKVIVKFSCSCLFWQLPPPSWRTSGSPGEDQSLGDKSWHYLDLKTNDNKSNLDLKKFLMATWTGPKISSLQIFISSVTWWWWWWWWRWWRWWWWLWWWGTANHLAEDGRLHEIAAIAELPSTFVQGENLLLHTHPSQASAIFAVNLQKNLHNFGILNIFLNYYSYFFSFLQNFDFFRISLIFGSRATVPM